MTAPPTELVDLRKKAEDTYLKKQYEQVIELLTDEVLETYKDATLYAWRARAHYRLQQNDAIMHYAQKAIAADDKYYMGYIARGNAWLSRGDYHKATVDNNRALALKPNDATAFKNLGTINYYKGNIDKAMEFYNKSIKQNPKDDSTFYNRAIVWSAKGNNKNAIDDLNIALGIDPNEAYTYYFRGDIYFTLKEYDKSLSDFESFTALQKADKYYIDFARSKIAELKKLIGDKDFENITDLVNKIKELLLFKKGNITHYTGLTVARELILHDSMFRLSEGAFLNDTSEGRDLFDYLTVNFSVKKANDGFAEPFADKPFIGSFVTAEKNNDLTLWRMYGKEAKEEAKGCSITIDMNQLIQNLKEKRKLATATASIKRTKYSASIK